MRPAPAAIALLAVMTAGSAPAGAGPLPAPAAHAPAPSSIVVAPFFQQVVEDLLAGSETLRSQYQRIVSTPHVLVRVEVMTGQRSDRAARATITRAASGLVLATVELAAPLREVEYAEMLAHELEHVLEQIEGISLADEADVSGRRASRLHDGSYETARARQAGRAAALEIAQAGNAPHP